MSAGHIQRRGAASWRLKYDIGRDPLTGKRITKFKTVTGTKRDAQRELRELLGAADKGHHVDPGKLTLGNGSPNGSTKPGTAPRQRRTSGTLRSQTST